MDIHENVIEWLDNDDMVAVTFHQKKWVNKVKRLSANPINNVTILAENSEGSVFAHLPIEMLKLSPKRKVQLTPEKKSELAERMASARARKLQ